MEIKNVKVGEHNIEILSDPEFFGFFNRNFQLVTKESRPDLILKLEGNYGVPFVNFDVEITKEPGKIFYRRADYLIEVDSEYRTAKLSVYDEFALRHALTHLYSSFILHHRWGLLVHSSCVLEDGKAHIFAGQSGAGKSTAAKLSHPRELLSDEATIVKVESGKVTVFDSPFRSEIESHGLTEPRPLSSVQFLIQALQDQREKVKKSDALLQLIDKVFYWPHSGEETRQIIGFLKELVDAVPVYKLYFRKNPAFWELIS